MTIDWAVLGGVLCGSLAGGAARFGRLCTMSAIEDALVARDFRAAKAWGLAVAVAIAVTQVAYFFGVIDLGRNPYTGPQVHLLGSALGGLLFGLGMTLVGTCSFGLLVRAGSGDLRAAVAALFVGVFAFAVTAGLLAPLRTPVLSIGVVTANNVNGLSILTVLGELFGPTAARWIVACATITLAVLAVADNRLRQRPRLIAGAIIIGLAVAAGWWTTSLAVEDLTLDRVESLSFVAPVGRALLQFMIEPFRNPGFGVSAMLATVFASFAVTAWRGELRWEAFDDAIEMRRHLFGAALMGIGGVLAHGCTIGQGMSAASTLAVSAPIFIIAVLCGAKLGLRHLIEGRSLWRRRHPAHGG